MGKQPWFQALARRYVRRRLRRTFSDVRSSPLSSLKRLLETESAILACNHVAWWDPLLLLHLETHLDCEGYCVMDAKSLDQLPFFRWVGALPIDRSNRRNAYHDLVHAGRILGSPKRLLAIFPQGQQQPHHLPLGFRPGVASLAAGTGAPVFPLAIRYDYLDGPRPVVHLSVGQALRLDAATDTKESFIHSVEHGIRRELNKVDESLIGERPPYPSLMGKTANDERLERLPAGSKALRILSKGGTS